MEEIAAPTGPGADPINLTFEHADLALLEEQANFFFYVKDNVNYLNYKRRQLAGEIGAWRTVRGAGRWHRARGCTFRRGNTLLDTICRVAHEIAVFLFGGW